MKLFLIRHGATPGNLKKQYIGSTDQPLAPEGIAQAEMRAAELPDVERVWCSPMLRTRQTADILYPDAPRVFLEGLRELDFGACEEKTWAQINKPAIYDRWLENDPQAAFPGGETLGSFSQRTSAALRQIAEQVRSEGSSSGAVVTHGGVLMALLSRHGVPKRGYFEWGCAPCGGFVVKLDPETLELRLIAPMGGGCL